MKKSTWLLDFQNNVYSQTGEDGIIEKILQVIGDIDKWCVEFGACDGTRFSNTKNLIKNLGYSAVLIEADKVRYEELKRNFAENKDVITVNKIVGFGADDNLDTILETTPIPRQFDFLSIDIDGNDYHVWNAIMCYEPKVICVEFNPTIPNEVEFVQKADPRVNQGTSISSFVELGRGKGYELISITLYNAFFVKKAYFPLFEIEDNSIAALRTSLVSVTYIFSGYDGTVFLRGSRNMPAHDIYYSEKTVQQLPKFLRKYMENYGPLEMFVYKIFRYWNLRLQNIKK
jgi:hypothetical protein